MRVQLGGRWEIRITQNPRITRAAYIKRVDEKSVEAMERLETELRMPVQSVKGRGRKADAVVPVGMA